MPDAEESCFPLLPCNDAVQAVESAGLLAPPEAAAGLGDAERCVPETTLQAVASYLLHQGRRLQSGCVAALQLDVARSTLVRNLRAASECALQASQKIHDLVVQYAHLHRDHGVQGVAYIERLSYDSTPARLRLDHSKIPGQFEGSKKEKCKVFVVQQEWALFRMGEHDDEPERQPGSAFLLVRGCYGTSGRVATRGTAEATCSVLESVGHTPPHLETAFKTLVRLVETDEESSNVRTEKLLPQLRHEKWRAATMHALCTAHKVHTAGERTWALSSTSLMSNIIHCLKCLSEVGVMRRLRQLICAEIPGRLRILYGGSPPAEVMDFRNRASSMLLPPEQAPRRRAHVQATLKLLNGNWLHKNVLEHYCSGPGCCESPRSTLRKLTKHLAKALTCEKPHMLARNNWREWSRQVVFLQGFQSVA